MNIVCPNCGQTCETDDELVIGQHMLCPFCNIKFTYDISASNTESKGAGSQIDVKCPSCGTEYEVEAIEIGQETECEVCGKRFVIGVKEKLVPQTATRETTVANQPNNAPTASVDYEGNRRYFSGEQLKRANMQGNLPLLLLICAFSVVIGIAGIGSGDGNGVIIGLTVVLGTLGFLTNYIVKAFGPPKYPSESEIDAQAKEMGCGLDDTALNKLGLDLEEVSMVKPLKLWGYRFVYPCVLGDADDAVALWITGDDGKLRSSEVSHTIFYFGEHSVYCYVRTTSLVNCHVSNERTEEYFYKDIVSVKTDSKVANRGGESHKVDVFVVVNTGGERLECEVENQSEADSVARAFRTLLKQKKL